jgi:hypothetical protein
VREGSRHAGDGGTEGGGIRRMTDGRESDANGVDSPPFVHAPSPGTREAPISAA